MKLNKLALIYDTVRSHFFIRFHGAEVCAEHDELFFHLEEPSNFSDKELELLGELGLSVYETDALENQVRSFVMYI